MAQPTPGSTKGQSSNSRKSASSFNAMRNTTSNQRTPSFNATRNSTNIRKSAPVLLSRKGTETTRARVIPVNQSRSMSTKKQPKSNSIRKKSSSTRMKKKRLPLQVGETQTHLLPIISLITTTMIILIVLSAMQVVTPSQVKTFSTMLIKGLLTVLFINNALKIIVLIPTLLQPLQIIHFLLLIKDAVTPTFTLFTSMRKVVEVILAFLFQKKENNLIKEAGTSTTTLTTFMKDVVEVLSKLLGLLKP